MKSKYNYEEAVSDAVDNAVVLVSTRLQEGWYDVLPSVGRFQQLAYKMLLRRWNMAIVREGERAKLDTYKLAQAKYMELYKGVLQ